jgi:hypothetical protein
VRRLDRPESILEQRLGTQVEAAFVEITRRLAERGDD